MMSQRLINTLCLVVAAVLATVATTSVAFVVRSSPSNNNRVSELNLHRYYETFGGVYSVPADRNADPTCTSSMPGSIHGTRNAAATGNYTIAAAAPAVPALPAQPYPYSY